MKHIHIPFKHFRYIVAIITLLAAIYVVSNCIVLMQPLLLFSAFLICCINVLESLMDKEMSWLLRGLHIASALLAIWGFGISVEMLQHSNRLVEYGTLLH